MATITFDAKTGETVGGWPPEGISGAVLSIIAAQLLPGMTPGDVDEAYSAFMSADEPQPFAVGAKARYSEGSAIYTGTVIQRREFEGELHSLLIRWPSSRMTSWHSPRELVEVKS